MFITLCVFTLLSSIAAAFFFWCFEQASCGSFGRYVCFALILVMITAAVFALIASVTLGFLMVFPS